MRRDEVANSVFHNAYAFADFCDLMTLMDDSCRDLRLCRLQKKYLPRCSRTSAAKAGSENKPVIAAVNHCATQNQVQHRLFSQAV
jgi:hypothetical protein